MRGKVTKGLRRFIENELGIGDASARKYVISPKGVIHVKPYTFRSYYQSIKKQFKRGKM